MTKVPRECNVTDENPANQSQVEINHIYTSQSEVLPERPAPSYPVPSDLHPGGLPESDLGSYVEASSGSSQTDPGVYPNPASSSLSDHGSEQPDMNAVKERESPSKGDKLKRKNRVSKSAGSSLDSGDFQVHGVTGSFDSTDSNGLQGPYVEGYEAEYDVVNREDMMPEDAGPHREMAVDCPESFVGASKAPPKYPPPSTPQAAHTMSRVPNSHEYYDSQDSSWSEQLTDAYSYTMPASNMQPKVTADQLERLHRHQEELRKRREEESRVMTEQEFLRTSLRGSKKLQALESSKRPPVGVVNDAFDEDSISLGREADVDGHATLPIRGQKEDQGYMVKNIGVDDMFAALNHLKANTYPGNEEDIAVISRLFQNQQFQNAVEVHQKVISATSQSPPLRAESNRARETVGDVITVLHSSSSRDAQELKAILQDHNFANLMLAQDRIAVLEAPGGESLPEDDFMNYPLTQYGEETVKIVHLEKTNEPLGATVRNEGENVIIGRIVKGGTAEKSGLLHEGDEILEINGIDMRGKSINEVSDMLANMSGTITFMIIPNSTQMNGAHQPLTGSVMHVKAHFNYDPEEDIYIPCRELGISFMKGDVLHVINQEDCNWWQAYREGEEEQHTLAGLIPSRTFQEQREAMRQTVVGDSRENEKKARKCACGKKTDKKKKKKALYTGGPTDEATEIQTYEEVVKYYPQPNRKRPIVLIGAPNVGRHELRQRLMESDFDRFAAAIPHTSRPLLEGETNGKDYYFVPRQIFEADIVGGKFIEHGEYEKNLYGTSLGAIRQVVNAGKICVLNLDPECLRTLRASDLKPYVIFVYPPNLEKLRLIRKKLGGNLSDEELKEIIEKAREMEENYGHYFDYILVNSDMDKAYDELLAEINRLEVEPQWVPRVWLDK
ncbi:protein PALS1-like [Liolophura sinensis]|uniref:protein PALS1-like n=1 Tax=Liolophura sinensis TaxID=3198878 RepID=UPI003159222B